MPPGRRLPRLFTTALSLLEKDKKKPRLDWGFFLSFSSSAEVGKGGSGYVLALYN